MIHGRNLIVALDGVAVAGAKSCSLQLSQDFIQACSPDSGRVYDKIPTTYDWSVSVDCLIPNSNRPVSLKDKLTAGAKCLLTFTDGDGDNRAGFVYVKSCNESGNIGSLATFSASFESSGALYKYNTHISQEFIAGREGGFSINPISFNNDRHYRIWEASFSISVKGKLKVRYYDDVAIVTNLFYYAAKNALANDDYQTLVAAAIEVIDKDEILIDVPAGSYTILFNTYYTEIPNPRVIFLYE